MPSTPPMSSRDIASAGLEQNSPGSPTPAHLRLSQPDYSLALDATAGSGLHRSRWTDYSSYSMDISRYGITLKVIDSILINCLGQYRWWMLMLKMWRRWEALFGEVSRSIWSCLQLLIASLIQILWRKWWRRNRERKGFDFTCLYVLFMRDIIDRTLDTFVHYAYVSQGFCCVESSRFIFHAIVREALFVHLSIYHPNPVLAPSSCLMIIGKASER